VAVCQILPQAKTTTASGLNSPLFHLDHQHHCASSQGNAPHRTSEAASLDPLEPLGLKKIDVSGYIGQKIRVGRSAKKIFSNFFYGTDSGQNKHVRSLMHTTAVN
jgi:hypothetical protein